MARQQEIKSTISVYGRADKSLDTLAKKVGDFGQSVSDAGNGLLELAQPIVDSVRDSLGLYADYDDVLRQIQAAGGYTEKQMEAVDAAARQAGADTRYMASDAAQAFLNLTQAGVGLNESVEVLPILLNAAAAGNMDLADASDLLISNIYSLGKAFDSVQTGEYMDKVVTASNATNTTVQEMMEGVSKVGAVGQMFGSDSELLAFLGMLANINRKGSEGGVDARNIILGLLAPTSKAADLMAELSLSADEYSEAMDGIDTANSAEMMQRLGLEVTDANGKVRPIVDILRDLNDATASLSDDKKATVLSAIFGKRTYAAVAGLMAQLEQYPELFDKITASAGSTQEKAETLEGGIGGAARRLNSAMQEMQISIAEAASDKAIEWMDSFRDFALSAADFVKDVDPDTVNSIMDGLSITVASGAALKLAGTGIKTISSVLATAATPGGALLLGVAALTALGVAMDGVQAAADKDSLENHFGTIKTDADKVAEMVGKLSGKYEKAAANLTSYNSAITTSGENYEAYVKQLSGGILEAYLADAELNDADKESLDQYATAMAAEVQKAISTQKLALSDFIDFSFDGSEEGDAEKKTGWQALNNAIFDPMNKAAEEAGQELIKTLYDAMFDGTIDENELAAIQRAQKKVSEIMAKVQSYQKQYDAKLAYARAMYLSEGATQDIFDAAEQEYQSNKDYVDNSWLSLMTDVLMAQDDKTPLPQDFLDAYGLKDAMDYQGALDVLQTEWQKDVTDARIAADELKARTLLNLTRTQVDESAGMSYEQILEPFANVVAQALEEGVTAEDMTTAASQAFAAAQDEAQNGTFNRINSIGLGYGITEGNLTLEQLEADMNRQIERTGSLSADLFNAYYQMLGYAIAQGQNAIFDETRLANFQKFAGYIDDAPAYNEKIGLNLGTTAGENYVAAAQQVFDDTSLKPQAETPDGEAIAYDILEQAQSVLDRNSLKIYASYGMSLKSSAPSGNRTDLLYADGGYADTPSIFGESGGEWAIPQEKTANTRSLLRRAAAASGFTGEELYPRAGVSFTFAPTIYAKDASDVKKTLEEERSALENMMDQWYTAKLREQEQVSFA